MTVTQMVLDYWDITSNPLTFSVNPQTLDDQIQNSQQETINTYQRYHIITYLGGIQTKNIILSGYFFGATKLTDYADLAVRFSDTTHLQKLYFQSDRFYLGIGNNIKMTQTSNRTNFTDYVATFQTVIGFLFGDTAKTSGTNAGNVMTYVSSITGHSNGGGDIVMSDAFGNSTTISSSSLSGTPWFHYYMIKLVNVGSGLYYTVYGYCEVSATQNGTYTQCAAVNSPLPVLELDVNDNVSTIGITNADTVITTFHNGWIV